MSKNPYKLGQWLESDYKVGVIESIVISGNGDVSKIHDEIKCDEEDIKLSDIEKQVRQTYSEDETLIIRVIYEMGLWGLMLHCISDGSKNKEWQIRGLAMGYA